MVATGRQAARRKPVGSELRIDVDNLLEDYRELDQSLLDYESRCIQGLKRDMRSPQGSHLSDMSLMVDTIQQECATTRALIAVAIADIADRASHNDLESEFLRKHRLNLRVVRQLCAVNMTASRWQAHAVLESDAAYDQFVGLDQIDEGSAFEFNYSRWHSQLAIKYEKKFATEFAAGRNRFALLTNSGMAAISLAMDIIHLSEPHTVGLFYFKGVYYGEAQRAILRFADRERGRRIDCSSEISDFLQQLIEFTNQHPKGVPIIYFDAISPMARAEASVDFDLIKTSLEEAKITRAYVLADVTRIGSGSKILDIFASSEVLIHVFEVESLAKYHLYGGDYTDGGIISFPKSVVNHFELPGSEHRKEQGLKVLRANNGYTFPDYLVRTLPTPNATRFRKRLERMGRNCSLLYAALKAVQRKNHKVEIRYVGDPQHGFYRWAASLGTFSSLIHFRHQGITRSDLHTRLVARISRKMLNRGHLIPIRGSYGFDETSLDKFGDGWIRLSAGTEIQSDISKICKSLQEVVLESISEILNESTN